MTDPFLAEIRLFSVGFAPRGWAQCNGQLLPINQNQALFALLGTTYGGDGRTTFGLPDLRGRHPVGFGGQVTLGERGGEETHTLTRAEIGEEVGVDVPATTTNPAGAVPARGGAYDNGVDGQTGSVGGGQPHPNMAPYLVLNYCIATQGIFPSQN